jgi:uncharacterized protein YlxW (UPF0749 family)
MPTMREMSEAHLTNVRNQVTMLREQQQKLAAEIDNLEAYLNEGSRELDRASSTIVSSSSADVLSAANYENAVF